MKAALDAEKRARLAEAEAIVRDILRPVKLARAEARKADRKERSKAIGKTAPEQRQERQQEPVYLQWIRRLPCAACAALGVLNGRQVEAAHLRFSDASRGRMNPGMQRKPDDKWTTPLCKFHHQSDQHTRKEQQFWSDLGIDPGQLCDDLYGAYCANREGLPIIAALMTEPSRPVQSRTSRGG